MQKQIGKHKNYNKKRQTFGKDKSCLLTKEEWCNCHDNSTVKMKC